MRKYRGEIFCAIIGIILLVLGLVITENFSLIIGKALGLTGITIVVWGFIPGVLISFLFDSLSIPSSKLLKFSILVSLVFGVPYTLVVVFFFDEPGLATLGLAPAAGIIVSMIGQILRSSAFRHK